MIPWHIEHTIGFIWMHMAHTFGKCNELWILWRILDDGNYLATHAHYCVW